MRRNSFLAIAVVLGLSACGDEGPSSPSAIDGSPSGAAVIGEGATALGATQFVLLSFRTTTTGRLEAVVDWTLASNTIWVYIARSCSVQQFSSPDCPFGAACSCEFLARSEVSQPKPRRLQASVAAGTYSIIVANLGPGDDSISYQLLFTSSSSLSPLTGSGLLSLETGAKPADPVVR